MAETRIKASRGRKRYLLFLILSEMFIAGIDKRKISFN
jgi:hypothetical protein